MKKILFFVLVVIVSLTLFSKQVEARGRYGSTRLGGYNSHGKGSHYYGGYVRSTHSLKYYLNH